MSRRQSSETQYAGSEGSLSLTLSGHLDCNDSEWSDGQDETEMDEICPNVHIRLAGGGLSGQVSSNVQKRIQSPVKAINAELKNDVPITKYPNNDVQYDHLRFAEDNHNSNESDYDHEMDCERENEHEKSVLGRYPLRSIVNQQKSQPKNDEFENDDGAENENAEGNDVEMDEQASTESSETVVQSMETLRNSQMDQPVVQKRILRSNRLETPVSNQLGRNCVAIQSNLQPTRGRPTKNSSKSVTNNFYQQDIVDLLEKKIREGLYKPNGMYIDSFVQCFQHDYTIWSECRALLKVPAHIYVDSTIWGNRNHSRDHTSQIKYGKPNVDYIPSTQLCKNSEKLRQKISSTFNQLPSDLHGAKYLIFVITSEVQEPKDDRDKRVNSPSL